MSRNGLEVSVFREAEEDLGVMTALAPRVSAADVAALVRVCRSQGVGLVVARCQAEDQDAASALRARGFVHVDSVVTWERDLVGVPLPPDPLTAEVRPVRPGEEDAVRRVAAEAFRGYPSHYSSDPRLDPARCDALYASIAYRACLARDGQEEVLVAERAGSVAALSVLRRTAPSTWEVVLAATAPEFRRLGIRRSLAAREMEWARDRGGTRLLATTQSTKVSWMEFWSRIGFVRRETRHTFHGWL